MKGFRSTGWIIVGMLVIIGVAGCNLWPREGRNGPTAPAGDPATLAGYAQMPGGSQIVTIGGTTYQVNLVVGNPGAAYGVWQYLEINQQQGYGKEPGTNQVPVQLQNVELHLTGLSSAVTEVVVATKPCPACAEYIEIGRYAVQDGTVTINVAYADLVRCFGPTHYAVWLKVLGGQNGTGAQPAVLTVTGRVNPCIKITVQVQYGTPKPTAPAPKPPGCPAGFFAYAGSCWTQCQPAGSNCDAVCAAAGVAYDASKAGWFAGMAGWTERYQACGDVLDALAVPAVGFGGIEGAAQYERCRYDAEQRWVVFDSAPPYNPWDVSAAGSQDCPDLPHIDACPCTTL